MNRNRERNVFEPSFQQVTSLLNDSYGISGALQRLAGENFNFQVDTPEGERFVLKINGPGVSIAPAELENRVIHRALESGLDLDLPMLTPTRMGHLESTMIAPDGTRLNARLLQFVQGTPWRHARPHPASLLRDLGAKLGALAIALSGLEHGRKAGRPLEPGRCCRPLAQNGSNQ